MSNYDQTEITKELQDLWALLEVAGAKIAQAITPLARTKWIDGDTVTPAASANGSEALPYATPNAFMAGIGVIRSVSDATQLMIGMMSPATVAAYTQNVAVQPYRNIELRGVGETFLSGILITGNVVWTNTAAQVVANGGNAANAPAVTNLTLHNVSITGNLTVTDDAVSSIVSISMDEGAFTAVAGAIDLTGATHVSILSVSGAGVGDPTSTANATGADFVFVDAAITGSVVCKALNAVNSSFINSAVFTFAAASSSQFVNCIFSTGSTPAITAGAGSTVIFDGASWRSFKEAGGTIVSGIVLVVGGSRAGIVFCPPTGAPTSIGDQSVSVSLDGTGATNAGGFNGTLGGNYYEASTALTGNRTVTLKTGGNELTGDTIEVVRRGAGISANTLSVTNNGGTETRTIAANQGGSQCWQFNTVVANDWGFIGGGGAIT